jgi:threonine/homoserine/homoserine lactone efflux protein
LALETIAGIFISSFLVAFSGAIMPGPVLTVTIFESSRIGFRAGPMIILGHGILEAILISMLVMGFAGFINNPTFLGIVGTAGGIVLLWMAFGMIRDIRILKFDSDGKAKTAGGPVAAGVLTSLSNPYWIIWWATIGLGYVVASMRFGIMGILLFFAGHILADLVWYSMVSYLVSRGKRLMNDRIYKAMITVCAGILVFFGVTFGYWGLSAFL